MTAWACTLPPYLASTLDPIALRLDLVPTRNTFSQLRLPERSFRSSDGGSFKLIDHHIDVAVVVKISKRTAAAAMQGPDARTRFVNQFFKLSIAKIAEYESRCLQRVIGKLGFYFGINRAGHDRKIRPAIIVEIGEPGPPADISSFHAKSRRDGHVGKVRSRHHCGRARWCHPQNAS